MEADASSFARRLELAFAAQRPSPDDRGARVESVRVVGESRSDFGLEVTFRSLRDNSLHLDRIQSVRSFLEHLAGPSPEDLAAHWIQELEEQILHRPDNQS